MDRGFINSVVNDFKSYGSQVLLIENPDNFLMREDVKTELLNHDIKIFHPENLEHRIAFELRDHLYQGLILAFISNDNSNYLEDILETGKRLEFYLKNYFKEYHLTTIKIESLEILEKLYSNSQIKKLSKSETETLINNLSISSKKPDFNYLEFKDEINREISKDSIDWHLIINKISKAIRLSIGTTSYVNVFETINDANQIFQKELSSNYKHFINASYINRPKTVASILDHIAFSSVTKKTALIVIDGMSWWQYQLLKANFPEDFKITETYTYAWLPSITQLSRQAIFRGTVPYVDYRQNPISEEKLWKEYWINKGLNKFEIRYNHQSANLNSLERVTKFAIVYKDLDDKMHSSSDYLDLKLLTINWAERSDLLEKISALLKKGFEIFLTTDHGNLPAKGWRGLNSREKLGTNKSGSRSQRHLEYSDRRLANEFLEDNPELKESLVQEEHLLYFKDELSFSRDDQIITHGGSHILEVLIPFVKITL